MRNGTAAEWTSQNPTLKLGELGIETDTRKFKIGDGATAWTSLKYGGGGNVEIKTVAPTTADNGYDIGTLWVDTNGKRAYILFAKTDAEATWVGLLDASGTIDNAKLADEAKKLQTARNITLKGAVVTNTKAFDGSGNIEFTLVLANSGVAAGTYTKLTVNAQGVVTGASQLTAADIPSLTLAKITDAGTAASKNVGTAAGNVPVLDSGAKIAVALIPNITLAKVSDAGTAAGKDVGTAAGNVPVLDANGLLDESILPAIALTDTFTVANQAEMLALNAQKGDIAIRTDENKTYILKANGASTLANWVMLKTPDCKVLSVNGKTGAITLTTDNIGEGSTNLYFTAARATANFNTNFAAKSVTGLKDGANVVMATDTITINGGKA
jgi:hypothetical protein